MGCKALFIGGIKSGKSKNAEGYTLQHTTSKPIYLATNEFFDEEMSLKVFHHKEQRADKFDTIEEALYISSIIDKQNSIVLVECVSMWINNMMYHKFSEADMIAEIHKIHNLKTTVVFVINDVSCSVVSDKKLVREFVDINGRISQLLAQKCEDVFHTTAGIAVKIK